MRVWLLLSLAALTGCSTAPVTNLLDHFAPSRYDGGKNLPRKPGDRDDDPSPPGVFPAEPRTGRGVKNTITELGEPVPEPAPPSPRL